MRDLPDRELGNLPSTSVTGSVTVNGGGFKLVEPTRYIPDLRPDVSDSPVPVAVVEIDWKATCENVTKQRDEARDSLDIAYSKGRADEHAAMRTLIQRHDCTYGDTPGLIHCPIDKPCTTHRLEREIERLRQVCAGMALGGE